MTDDKGSLRMEAASGLARGLVRSQKLRVPSQSSSAVVRDRPELAVPTGSPPITLVCAPAGSGKTVLLSGWARQLRESGHCAAWVSLDPGDSDPAALWGAVLAALEEATGRAEFAALVPPAGRSDGFLTAFAHAVDDARAEVWLFLDDVHDVTGAGLEGFNTLIRRLPDHLRVVLGTRFVGDLAISRLRLEGAIRELTARHLAFRVDEAAAMLRAQDLSITEDDIRVLVERTDGWATGLRAAALSLPGAADVHQFVADFSGRDRTVDGFLSDEIIRRLDPEVVEFILAISVAERVNSDLAAALSGRADAGRLLAELDRNSVLVERLGTTNEWYRLHSLLRDWSMGRLAEQDSAAPLRQHAAAADWYDANDQPYAALGHRIAARDWPGVLRAIAEHGLRLQFAGRSSLVAQACATLPEGFRDDPYAVLVEVVGHLDRPDVAAAERALARVGFEWQRHDDPKLQALHLGALLYRARLTSLPVEQKQELHDASRRLPADVAAAIEETDLELLVTANRGTLGIQLGATPEVEADLLRALDLAQRGNRDYLALHCMSYLSGVMAALDRLPEMVMWGAQAVTFAENRGWTDSPRLAISLATLAWSYYLLDDLDQAVTFGRRAESLLDPTTDPDVEVMVGALRAVLEMEQPDQRRQALSGLRAMWARHTQTSLTPALVAEVALHEVCQAVEIGEMQWAVEAIERVQERIGPIGDIATFEALVDLERDRPAAAQRRLDPVLAGDLPTVGPSTPILAWGLQAQLADRADRPAVVRDALHEALKVGERNFAVRQFAFWSPAVQDLLRQHAGRFGPQEAFADQVRAALATRATATWGRPNDPSLTARELDVLRELSSLRTVDEIAQVMQLSLNTVKSHTRSIYRKLGAANRRERARAGPVVGQRPRFAPAAPYAGCHERAREVARTPQSDHGRGLRGLERRRRRGDRRGRAPRADLGR